MRIRWLFILLLGAIQIHLSGSEFLVDKDGDRMDTAASNLTTENDPYGDWAVNGSESRSTMEKIRRTRGLTNDLKEQLETAEKELAELESEKTTANKLDDNATANVTAIGKKLEKAVDKLRQIEKDYNNAMTNQTETAAKFLHAIEYKSKNATSLLVAEKAYNATKAESLTLNETAEGLKNRRKVEEDALKEAEKDRIMANFVMEDISNNLTDAVSKLRGFESSSVTSNTTLSNAISSLEKVLKIIQDYETYVKMQQNETGLNDKRSLSDNQEKGANEAKGKLDADLQSIRENKLLTVSSQYRTDFKGMSLDQAILDWSQRISNLTNAMKELGANATEEEKRKKGQEISDLTFIKTSLIQIQSLEYGKRTKIGERKVQDIIDNIETLKRDIGIARGAEARTAQAANTELKAIDAQLNELKGLMNGVTTKPTELEVEYNTKKNKEAALRSAVKTANETFVKDEENVRNKKAEIKEIGDALEKANATFIIKAANETRLEKIEREAEIAWKYADGNATLFAKNDLQIATKNKDSWKQMAEKAINDFDYLHWLSNRANETANKKTEEKKGVDEEISRINDELTEAKATKEISGNKALTAFKKHYEQNNKVTTLKADFLKSEADDLKEEERRQASIAALTTGLGVTGGLLGLVIVGGVIAFIVIRRRKTVKKEKKPKREILQADNGLTILRKEGQADIYGFMGEDFRIMGPLVRKRVKRDEVPLKHMLDDQVGGDKIEGDIKFDKNLNEAYFIGEGVEICEDDSVSISESQLVPPVLTDNDVDACDKYQKEDDHQKVAPKSGDKKGAPKSDEKKDEKKTAPSSSEEKKSSKSKRSNDPNAKNAISPLNGEAAKKK